MRKNLLSLGTALKHVTLSKNPNKRYFDTDFTDLCSVGQKHRVNPHYKPKSVLYSAMKLWISTINQTLSRGTCVTQAFNIYVHEDYFIFGHLHPAI